MIVALAPDSSNSWIPIFILLVGLENESNVSHSTLVKNYPSEQEYNSIQEGTFHDCVDSILLDGFKPEMCKDPSFGMGIYLTPCIRMAKAYTCPGGISDSMTAMIPM